tara:strand:- start:120 stop:494 length:375 start_codon:yes stop_codon:yes gene_type:complete
MMTIYTKGFSTFRQLNRFFPRLNFSKDIQRKPYINSFSENETFSKLFQSQEKPLGRWCTPISSNKCNPEIKADNANEDNGPGLKNNYPIIAKKQKPQPVINKSENFDSNEDLLLVSYYSENIKS